MSLKVLKVARYSVRSARYSEELQVKVPSLNIRFTSRQIPSSPLSHLFLTILAIQHPFLSYCHKTRTVNRPASMAHDSLRPRNMSSPGPDLSTCARRLLGPTLSACTRPYIPSPISSKLSHINSTSNQMQARGAGSLEENSLRHYNGLNRP